MPGVPLICSMDQWNEDVLLLNPSTSSFLDQWIMSCLKCSEELYSVISLAPSSKLRENYLFWVFKQGFTKRDFPTTLPYLFFITYMPLSPHYSFVYKFAYTPSQCDDCTKSLLVISIAMRSPP